MLNPPDSTSQSREGAVEFDFPDEIVVEILTRLPATDVVRLRCVCKSWRDLTCTHNFTLLHLRRCLPVLLSHKICIRDSGLLCEHDQYLPLQTKPKIYQFGKVSEFHNLSSYDGLLVMNNYADMNYRAYTIMNLMFHEKVRIIISEEIQSSEHYGVFFHPSLKVYCALFSLNVTGDFTEYKILTLGSKPCWRDLNNPWSHIDRVCRISPVLIDEHIYWVLEPKTSHSSGTLPADIMEFDIRKEEFTFIFSPVPEAYTCSEYNINLFDIGGLLSLVQTSVEGRPLWFIVKEQFEVNIWTLKDHARKLWTMSSYRINTCPFLCSPDPMALLNDELVLHDCRRLFSYNLKLGTLRKLEGKRCNLFSLKTHVMSLVSLRNCKSMIYINKRGEVKNRRKRRRRRRIKNFNHR